MRKLLSSIILVIFTSIMLIPIDVSLAAQSSEVVGFEIIAPSTAKVNEAIDITVRAIDKDKKIVPNYNGSILFVSENFSDELPSPGKAIQFTQESGGQIKFSKGVKFRSVGKQKISVIDIENSTEIIGETTVNVEPGDAPDTVSSTETVTIVTPIQNSKITDDMVVVSGKTKKNSKLTILLNGQDRGNAISDDTGLFTKTLSDITQEKNILQVQLLDGTNTILARSEDVVFDKITQLQGFYNILVTPGTSVEVSTPITITVEGAPNMNGVSVMIDNASIPLTEKESGKYSAQTPAPAVAGAYHVDVFIKDNAGQSFEKKAAITMNITAQVFVPTFSNIKATTQGKKVTFTFAVNNIPAELDKFKIAYGEDADALSQEVITFSASKIQGSDGMYSWYIDNVDPKYDTFKIFGLKSDTSLISNFVSNPIITSVGAQSCTIGNVGNIVVTPEPGKSVLTWTSLTGALSYNVYKISPAGDHILIQNVVEPKYVIYHAQGEVTYDDFAVKALCAEGSESTDMSKASKVQTGPEALALLVIISGIMGVVLLRKRVIS